MNATTIATIRNGSFSLLGLVLLGYALAVLFVGRPDPMPPWVPGLAGALTALVVTLISRLNTRAAVSVAWDELTRSEWARSLRGGYWMAVWMYAAFGLALFNDIVTYPQAFAAMGTLTGAAPCLLFLRAWIKGRV